MTGTSVSQNIRGWYTALCDPGLGSSRLARRNGYASRVDSHCRGVHWRVVSSGKCCQVFKSSKGDSRFGLSTVRRSAKETPQPLIVSKSILPQYNKTVLLLEPTAIGIHRAADRQAVKAQSSACTGPKMLRPNTPMPSGWAAPSVPHWRGAGGRAYTPRQLRCAQTYAEIEARTCTAAGIDRKQLTWLQDERRAEKTVRVMSVLGQRSRQMVVGWTSSVPA